MNNDLVNTDNQVRASAYLRFNLLFLYLNDPDRFYELIEGDVE